MIRTFTPEQRAGFWTYFNVADEIYDSLTKGLDQRFVANLDQPLTLADLDIKAVAAAQLAANDLELPWPPYLPAAEEYALDHRKALQDD